MNYEKFRLTIGVVATLGLYSMLYRENKFYRFFEHLFLGLGAGWSLVAVWTETLKNSWWDKLIGSAGTPATEAAAATAGTNGHWAFILLLPIGFLAYSVFSKKHNWMSRIPIGILLGLWSGQQIQVWANTYLPQVAKAIKPVIPTTFAQLTTSGLSPEALKASANEVYLSQALTNVIFIVTLVSVLSYFLFSFDTKHKLVQGTSMLGRWLLMVGFGAIFGSTVMMRFTLLIDRMYFIWIEWLMGLFSK